jgi:hypothetical protein
MSPLILHLLHQDAALLGLRRLVFIFKLLMNFLGFLRAIGGGRRGLWLVRYFRLLHLESKYLVGLFLLQLFLELNLLIVDIVVVFVPAHVLLNFGIALLVFEKLSFEPLPRTFQGILDQDRVRLSHSDILPLPQVGWLLVCELSHQIFLFF